MRIEGVDVFYLAMPEIRDIGDGSQDACLVRVTSDNGLEGWGQCEASPLACIAARVAPMSHSACKPVGHDLVGRPVNSPEDIWRINAAVRADSLDLLQADHMLSGIDIAMWDLLGRKLQRPVYELLGYERAYAKLPYASQLFGDDPQATLAKGRAARKRGFRAMKFGWGPYGRGSVKDDADQVAAAREGIGPDALLLVDAGTVWVEDVSAAEARLEALAQHRAVWLEEPFVSGALDSYRRLAGRSGAVKLAGGEGAHNAYMARHLIDHGGIGFVQIDTGRVGGITSAMEVAEYARNRGVTYVNHTFTSHLSLSASLQPMAGVRAWEICEYPVEPSPLSADLAGPQLNIDGDGWLRIPEAPGLGLTPDPAVIERYRVPVEIRVGGKLLYASPPVRR